MKELSIEEKAKAYDEALEQARKELKTCGSLNCDAARQIFRFFPELTENEDEKIRKFLIKCVQQPIGTNLLNGIKKDDVIVWLEKQKGCIYTADDIITAEDHAFLAGADWQKEQNKKLEKQGEQNNLAWSEADEKQARQIKRIVHDAGCAQKLQEQITDWLKSLKDRVPPQTKQEWSEEDEEIFDAIIADILFTQKAHPHEANQVIFEREIDWLKSLKERMIWRPTEEQMKALNNVITEFDCKCGAIDTETIDNVQDLYEDLKKL